VIPAAQDVRCPQPEAPAEARWSGLPEVEHGLGVPAVALGVVSKQDNTRASPGRQPPQQGALARGGCAGTVCFVFPKVLLTEK